MARQQWAYIANIWRNASPADRESWDEPAKVMVWYDRLGHVIVGRGYWLFTRCARYMISLGLVPRTDWITPAPLFPSTHFAVTLTSAGLVVIGPMDPDPIPADMRILVRISRPFPPTQANSIHRLHILGSCASGTHAPYLFTAEYFQLFGFFPPAGQYSSVSLQAVNTQLGTSLPPVTAIAVWV
jgi:hypothetical protein